jgi:hypothetical protein
MWMEAANPFAQVPTTPEPIIAQVRRQLADDDHIGMRVPMGVLDRVADHAVRELWSSRVKNFIPVLALRTAREMLRDQEGGVMLERPQMDRIGRNQPVAPPRREGPPRDVLLIDGDVLTNDDRDRLPL